MIEHIGVLTARAKVITPIQIVKQRVTAGPRKLTTKWTIETKQPIRAYMDPSVAAALAQQITDTGRRVMEMQPFEEEDEWASDMAKQMTKIVDDEIILKRVIKKVFK